MKDLDGQTFFWSVLFFLLTFHSSLKWSNFKNTVVCWEECCQMALLLQCIDLSH